MHNISFSKLDDLKSTLDSHHPLSKEIIKNLHNNFLLNWTFHSNAIEGNTLTLKETKVVLEGVTIGGKSLREHCETINHKEAIIFINSLAQHKERLSELDIKSIHTLILKNIDQDNAGKYRSTNVLISGVEHRPPESVEVPILMQEFIQHRIFQKNTFNVYCHYLTKEKK